MADGVHSSRLVAPLWVYMVSVSVANAAFHLGFSRQVSDCVLFPSAIHHLWCSTLAVIMVFTCSALCMIRATWNSHPSYSFHHTLLPDGRKAGPAEFVQNKFGARG